MTTQRFGDGKAIGFRRGRDVPPHILQGVGEYRHGYRIMVDLDPVPHCACSPRLEHYCCVSVVSCQRRLLLEWRSSISSASLTQMKWEYSKQYFCIDNAKHKPPKSIEHEYFFSLCSIFQSVVQWQYGRDAVEILPKGFCDLQAPPNTIHSSLGSTVYIFSIARVFPSVHCCPFPPPYSPKHGRHRRRWKQLRWRFWRPRRRRGRRWWLW